MRLSKKVKAFIVPILLACVFTSGCSASKSSASKKSKEKRIGAVVGTFDDTWRTSLRNQLYKMAEGKVELDIWSGDNSQEIENSKIDEFIKEKVDVLVVNLVEPNAAVSIINKAKKADIPVIFFNMEPSSDSLKMWNKVYYVGAKAQQSGKMQGQILADYFKSHVPQNNTIKYVMLKGVPNSQDTILRSEYSVSTLKSAGFKIEKVSEDNAMWLRSEGENKMKAILASGKQGFNCVIANNDDMALGAIDALKSKEYFGNGKYIPVVGVDANSSALGAVKKGTLLGTVLNNSENQGRAIFELATILASDIMPNKNNYKWPVTNNKYIWIDYKIITRKNIYK